MENQPNQQILMQLASLEQEMREIQERIALIDQQTIEMQQLELNLDEIKKNKDKEILAGIGKGIFIKSKIQEEDLFVDVGGIVLKKNVEETKEIIKDQVKKMFGFKQILIGQMEALRVEIENIINQVEKTK